MIHTSYEGTKRKYDTAVFERSVLSNGIPVWLQKLPVLVDERGIIIACFPNVGSIQDNPRKQGVAHFFEHIPFRGTLNKPTPRELLEPLENIGGSWGGTTSTYWTKYVVSTSNEYIELAAETVKELATAPLIRKEEVALERSIITQEHHREYGSGVSLAGLHIRQRVFGDQPFGNVTLGTLESIQSITEQDLREFQRQFYHSANMQLVCGGNFATDPKVMDTLEQTFGSLPKPNKLKATLPKFPTPLTNFVELSNPLYGRSHLTVMWLFNCPADRRAYYALRLIAKTMAGSINAPLVKVLRQQLGILYEVGLLKAHLLPNGLVLSVGLPVPAENFDTALELTMQILGELSEDALIANHRSWQQSRKTYFEHPISACHSVIEEITVDRPYSFREVEIENDSIELEEVFSWRDRLLNTKPIVAKVHVQ